MRVDDERGLLVCNHCGTEREAPAWIRYVELLGETSSVCPTCSTPLSTGRFEGRPFLCCARCFGVLIPMNQFADIINAARAHEERSFQVALPRRQNPGDRTIGCPTCGEPMLSHLYGGPGNVVIDSCERCHVNWLDAGELRRIAIAPERLRRADSAIDLATTTTDETEDDD